MTGSSGKLRIIGGKWRSRQISFNDAPGLRPTTDRIRETLFNWLAPFIDEANCLDLFAGSGALGFEALSRGAAKVTFVDSSLDVIKILQENTLKLQADNAEFICAKCPDKIPKLTHVPFDIIFLDPPFNKDLIAPTLDWLQTNNLLRPPSLIYIEAEKELTLLPVLDDWQVWREKSTSSLVYYLLKRG